MNEFFTVEHMSRECFRAIEEGTLTGDKIKLLYEALIGLLWPDHYEFTEVPKGEPRQLEGISPYEIEGLGSNLWGLAMKGSLLLAPEIGHSFDREVVFSRFPALAYLIRYIPREEWQSFKQAYKDFREITIENRTPYWLEVGFDRSFRRSVQGMSVEKTILMGILQSLSILFFRSVAGEVRIEGVTTRPLIFSEDTQRVISSVAHEFLKQSENSGSEATLLRVYTRSMEVLRKDRSKATLDKRKRMAAAAMLKVPYFTEHFPEIQTRLAIPTLPKEKEKEVRVPRPRRRLPPDRRRY